MNRFNDILMSQTQKFDQLMSKMLNESIRFFDRDFKLIYADWKDEYTKNFNNLENQYRAKIFKDSIKKVMNHNK